MNERVHLDIDAAGVAHVQLNRPERMNALDGLTFDAILEVAQHLQALPRLRAVVLSGAGKSFCAGLDISQFQRMGQAGAPGVDLGDGGGQRVRLVDRTHGIANRPQQAVLCWQQLPVPVIAALHGAVFGGGLQIALGADLRLATADARLSVMEVAWGLVPDMAGMVLMRELLRGDVMRELVYSGREVLGQEAQALGLVTRVCADPLAEAQVLAAGIARHSPDAVRAAKRLLNTALGGAPAAEVLLAEAREQDRLIGSPNQLETVAARFGKRAPQHGDPPV